MANGTVLANGALSPTGALVANTSAGLRHAIRQNQRSVRQEQRSRSVRRHSPRRVQRAVLLGEHEPHESSAAFLRVVKAARRYTRERPQVSIIRRTNDHVIEQT